MEREVFWMKKNTVDPETFLYIMSLEEQLTIQKKLAEAQNKLIDSLQEENNQLKALIKEYLLVKDQNTEDDKEI